MNITKGKIQTAQKVVIYGPEGIGKSTFASQFPEPLFCDTEGSTKALDVMRFDRPDSAQMIYECIDYVKAHPDSCKTFVLDTADWAEKLIIKMVCDKHNWDGIEAKDYGKGYVYVYEEFGKLLNQLEDLVELEINVVITAHAKLKKFEQPDETGSYDRWTLKLISSQSCSNAALIKEWADTVLFINYKTYVEQVDKKGKKFKASGGRRVMYTSHHPCWDAKNRWGLPEECDFDYRVIMPFIPASQTANTPPAPEPPNFGKPNSTNPVDELLDTEEPQRPSAPAVKESLTPAADYTGIPKPLRSLMTANSVTEEDIRLVVSQQGYYPFEARVKDYDPEFVDGCLVAAWDQVFSKIMSNKDLPFGMNE